MPNMSLSSTSLNSNSSPTTSAASLQQPDDRLPMELNGKNGSLIDNVIDSCYDRNRSSAEKTVNAPNTTNDFVCNVSDFFFLAKV